MAQRTTDDYSWRQISVEAIRRETVELLVSISNNEVQHCQLFEVLYGPQLSYNLLSVSKHKIR